MRIRADKEVRWTRLWQREISLTIAFLAEDVEGIKLLTSYLKS